MNKSKPNQDLDRFKEKACTEYVLNGGDRSKAYRKAYAQSKRWKDKTVHEKASRLFSEGKVEARVQELQEEAAKIAAEQYQVEASDVIRQLVRMGFADVRKLFTPEGQLRSVHDMDDDTAAAIQSIEVVTKFIPGPGDEPPEVEYLHKIKMVDKIKPLELIGKHMGKQLGQWAERMEHGGKDGGPIEVTMVELVAATGDEE
ncbi:terminase small subunit [Vreelandella neptunia]|uniref:terminase small subunit n=1 Tax=Vreelandella neptunia TaxID=115551 RepID=UPI003159B101